MKLYVGNLPYATTEEDLKKAFEAFGKVESATIIKDKFSGRSKGFGFVEMSTEDEAKAAVAGMNGKDMGGRALKVDIARPPAEGGGRRGGGGGRFGAPRAEPKVEVAEPSDNPDEDLI